MAYEPVGPGGVSNNYGVRETTPSDKYSPTVRYDEEWTPKDNTIVTAKTDPVTGGITKIWTGTQAQYDAIATKADDTLYIIVAG